MSNSSIRPIGTTLSVATTPDQCGPRSNGNKGTLHITQSFRTEVSRLDSLVLYQGHSLWGLSYSPAEMQSVYSTATANWAIHFWAFNLFL